MCLCCMAAIKKWFQDRKADVKFKKAGAGHSLTEPSPTSIPSSGPRAGTSGGHSHARPIDSEAKQKAAEAALLRYDQKATSEAKALSRHQQAIREQARRELEAAEKSTRGLDLDSTDSSAGRGPEEREFDSSKVLSVQGVYFTCPVLENVILPMDKMLVALEQFFREQSMDEPLLAAATILHSLNRIYERRKAGIEALVKYLDNILGNPAEEKYRRIRLGNKVLQEKVLSLRGAEEFLLAAGFERKELPAADGSEGNEPYFVMTQAKAEDSDSLELAREYLLQSEPIPIELYRNPQVYKPCPSGQAARMELPAEFFDRTSEEIKREQQVRHEETEKVLALRTKKMRERDEIKRKYRYRYVLIRIRFPDNYILQGTFRSSEQLDHVRAFVQSHIALPEMPFELFGPTGAKLDLSDERNLTDLGLAPAALLGFRWDPDVAASGVNEYLHPDAKASALELIA